MGGAAAKSQTYASGCARTRSWAPLQGKRGGEPLNVMQMIARNMNDEQIRAVALYFASVRPAGVTPDDRFFLEPQLAEPPVSKETGTDMGAFVEPQPGRGGVVVPDAETIKQPQRGTDGE